MEKINLFLDSGAYSAKTQGVEIDIDEYAKFIKENENLIEVYANLDVIGDAEGTYQNQKYLESLGLHPMPVFHYGEPEKYLHLYMKDYDYIALGGLVGGSKAQLIYWLDDLFSNHLTDEDGIPKAKFHGFGLTSLFLMLRYPWYSVDSTSWVMTGRMGSIFVPRRKNGKWIYDKNSWKINVSSKSPMKNQAGKGKHISTMSKLERELLFEYLEEKGFKLGKSEFRIESDGYELQENEKWDGKAIDGKRRVEKIIELGVSNDYKIRDEINIVYFLDLEKSMPSWPWPFKKRKSSGFDLSP